MPRTTAALGIVGRFGLRFALPALGGRPDFVIIGAQKAGTTSLFSYLSEHPDARGALRKEVHYFDYRLSMGERWYRAHFERRAPNATLPIRFEASPSYLFHPLVPARFAASLPTAQVVVLLRDPVSRAYSHYRHELRKGRETLSFAEAIAAEPARTDHLWDAVVRGHERDPQTLRSFSYERRGRYAEQLERWIAAVGRHRMLIIDSESFFANPGAVVGRACEFVGLRPIGDRHYAPQNQPERYPPGDEAVLAELARRFRPHNERLFKLLGQEFAWR